MSEQYQQIKEFKLFRGLDGKTPAVAHVALKEEVKEVLENPMLGHQLFFVLLSGHYEAVRLAHIHAIYPHVSCDEDKPNPTLHLDKDGREWQLMDTSLYGFMPKIPDADGGKYVLFNAFMYWRGNRDEDGLLEYEYGDMQDLATFFKLSDVDPRLKRVLTMIGRDASTGPWENDSVNTLGGGWFPKVVWLSP